MADQVIGVRMPPVLATRIHAESTRRGISESALVREIITEYFVAEESITQRLADQIIGRLTQAVSAAIRDVWSEEQISALGGALAWAVLTAEDTPGDQIAAVVRAVQDALLRKE